LSLKIKIVVLVSCVFPTVTESGKKVDPGIFADFYSAAALHAMQSAVIPTAIPSVRLSVRPSHAGTLSRRMNIGLRDLYCEVAKTL